MARFKFAFVIGLFLVCAFALGYVPQELDQRRTQRALEATELDLRLANLHRQIGMASHEAQRNNFAVASTEASRFFDGCRAVIDEYDFAERPRTRLALSAYASSRDIVLGQLATADPAVKERLSSLFITMNGLLERRQ
jgi:hypothetical protein